MARQDVTIRRAPPYEIVYSVTADRANPQPLHGATVTGVIYALLTPTSDVSEVTYWKPLHPGPFREDNAAPFDLVGDDGVDALALQVSDHWPDGPAELAAVVVAPDGSFTVTAEFTAIGGAQPEPTQPDVSTAIAVAAAVPTPMIVIAGGGSSTAQPATVTATATVPGTAASTPTGSPLKDAVGYFAGNAPTPGSNGARSTIEELEAVVGRRIKYASSNFGVKLTTATLSSCTTDAAMNTITKSGHGLTVRDTVHMTSPEQAGIKSSTAYWVVNPTSTTFQIASTKGGSALDITANVSVTFAKHIYIGGALNSVDSFYRGEWATRPDVTHAVIFHMWQVAQVSGQQKSPPPAFRRSRRLEVIAGSWDATYNAFLNKLHRSKSGASYDAATGWISDTAHGQYVGERIIVTAQASSTAFTVSTEANPTYYYVLEKEANRYKVTVTPPWEWDTASEVAVTGGGNGTLSTVWRFNIQFRISHEGDIPYSGGYPDGRLWPDVTADDEVKCRQSWEHVCDLIHTHGFKTVWAGNGNMFHKIYQAGNSSGAVMSPYKTSFPGDERGAWEYGLPGSTHSGSPSYTPNHSGVKATYDGSGSHTGGYIDYLDLDVYYGANGSGGKSSSASLAYIDELVATAAELDMPWSIAELGIFLVSSVGPTNVSASAATDLFTASNGHGFTDNMPVVVGYAGTAPSPIKKNEGTVYYVDYETATQFGLRATSNGPRIALTSDGQGLSVKRWAQIPDATSGSLMSAKDWLNAVWDRAAASGNCHYINYFWAGGDSSTSFFTRTNLKIWAPGAYQAVFGTGRLAGA